MAPKRLSEIPPPSASSSSSSSEGEEENESQEQSETEDEESDQLGDDQAADGDKQKEDSSDDDDEDPKKEKESPLLKKQTIPDNSPESDSNSGSESTPPSPSPSDFTVKLHKPSPKPNKIGLKRAAESDNIAKEIPSKKKIKAAGGVGDEEEPKNGSAIQRLWSEDDEIAILVGLNQYRSEKGADPYADMGAFHEFIKKSLHVDVSKNQLVDKIRRLKKKYQTNKERGENGQDPVFSKTHDLKSFELSRKVWNGNERNTDKNGRVKQTGRVQNNGSGVTLGLLAKRQMRAPPNGEIKCIEKSQVKREENLLGKDQVWRDEKREDEERNMENLWEKYPFLSKSLDTEALSDGVKVILREHLGMIEKRKLKELEHRWRSLKQAEMELFVQRIELVNEQVKLTLDSINA